MYKFKKIMVPLDGSELAESALDPALVIAESMGAEVKFTSYPLAGHDSWTETYQNRELYDWFLLHERE